MRLILTVTAVAAIASYFAKGYAALTFQFITTFFVAGAIALCMRRMGSGLLAPRRAGWFIGCAFTIMAVSGAVLFFLPFAEIPTGIILIVLCVFLAIAAVAFETKSSDMAVDYDKPSPLTNYEPLAGRLVRLAFLVLCLYALVAGLLDNIYFFNEAFDLIPNFMFYILLYAAVTNVAAGFLFGRMDAAAAVICAFVLICAGQSMSYFSQNVLLVYPYTILSNAGNNFLAVYLTALPIAYCAVTGRKPGILPGLGYILLYGSFLLTSILFEFVPATRFESILGIAMLVSVAAIITTFYLMNENKGRQLRRLQAALNEALADAPGGGAVLVNTRRPCAINSSAAAYTAAASSAAL
jgi:hypothetical protein